MFAPSFISPARFLPRLRHLPTTATSSSSRICLPPHANLRTDWPQLSSRAQAVLDSIPTTLPNYVTLLQQSAHADPENPFLWHALAKHILQVQNNPDHAVQILKQAVNHVPVGRRGGLFELWTTTLLRRGEEHSTIQILEQAVETDPYGPLYVSLGSLQAKHGHIIAARQTFETGTTLFKAHSAIWRAWATLESRAGNIHRAVDLWRIAVQRDLYNARAWQMLALHEERVGMPIQDLSDLLYRALEYCGDDPGLRLHLAKTEVKRGRKAEAVRILEVIEKDGDDKILRTLGRLVGELGEKERARQIFASLKSLKGKHAWAIWEMRMGDKNIAKEVLEQCLNRADGGVWRAWGEIMSIEGRIEEARKAFKRSLKHKWDWRVILGWGKMEAKKADSEKGRELLERVIEEVNEKKILGEALRERGMLAGREGESAVEWLRRAVEVEADYAPGWRLLAQHVDKEEMDQVFERGLESVGKAWKAQVFHWWGSEQTRKGEWQQAREKFQQAIRCNKNYMSAWMSWALMEKRLGDALKCREIFRMAGNVIEEENIKAPYVFLAWARVEEELGGIEEAAKVLQRAVTIVDEGAIWRAWGGVEERRGMIEKARELYKNGTKRGGEECWFAWAIMEMKRGELNEAARLFGEGDRRGASPDGLSAWGKLEARRGNVDKARHLFKRAVELDPYYATAWNMWGDLEMERGNLEEGERLKRKAEDVEGGQVVPNRKNVHN